MIHFTKEIDRFILFNIIGSRKDITHIPNRFSGISPHTISQIITGAKAIFDKDLSAQSIKRRLYGVIRHIKNPDDYDYENRRWNLSQKDLMQRKYDFYLPKIEKTCKHLFDEINVEEYRVPLMVHPDKIVHSLAKRFFHVRDALERFKKKEMQQND